MTERKKRKRKENSTEEHLTESEEKKVGYEEKERTPHAACEDGFEADWDGSEDFKSETTQARTEESKDHAYWNCEPSSVVINIVLAHANIPTPHLNH